MKQIMIIICLLLCSSPLHAKTTGATDECLSCHSDLISSDGRQTRMKGSSHHVQGVPLSGTHCYACHWEAMADGRVNDEFHQGKIPDKNADRKVHLVVWTEGKRPLSYKPESTAVIFHPSRISTLDERQEIGQITSHCLGCHSDSGKDSLPFAGDMNQPVKYAWDGQSISSRYSQGGTTTWGKYSTATSNKKQRVVKAFSAHGNASANMGGWDKGVGYDGDMPASRGGVYAKNIECFDCHNSHGSSISGVTSSYRTADGSFNGGILKQTASGKSGYIMTYSPSVNSYGHAANPFNPGAGLCFDCHETATAGSTPWGYSTTFGATQPIMGYKDTLGFGPGMKGSSYRFSNRNSRETLASSHLKTETPLSHIPKGQINGLCTPCHDPHGISQTLAEKQSYAVPLLKGTWLTSPYREDGPPGTLLRKVSAGASLQSDFNRVNRDASANFGRGDSSASRSSDYNTVNREANANFGKGTSPAPREADYNQVNRDASANFGKGDSSSPRAGDYNTVNREANANFGKGTSSAPRQTDYNQVNREVSANFGKGDSSSPRAGDYNSVNREASANFGKGTSTAPRQTDYNQVNRDASANFGKGDSSSARAGDYNSINRDANANFGKGTSGTARETDANAANRDAGSNFARNSSSAPREPMKGMKYNVDRNTFADDARITEAYDVFGGICLTCHPKEKLSGETRSGLLHRAVKGWGNNREHSFPCSKCHQSHNSGLPRLMQTNCFEQGPAGLRENSGLPWLPFTKGEAASASAEQPAAAEKTSAKTKIVGCHVKQFGKATAASATGNENEWKDLVSW